MNGCVLMLQVLVLREHLLSHPLVRSVCASAFRANVTCFEIVQTAHRTPGANAYPLSQDVLEHALLPLFGHGALLGAVAARSWRCKNSSRYTLRVCEPGPGPKTVGREA